MQNRLLVLRIRLVFRKVSEELLDRAEAHVVSGHERGGWVVLDFDGVVEGADARGCEQVDWGVQGEFAVVDDIAGVEVWVEDGGFDAAGLGVAGDEGTLGGGEGGGDGDVVEVGLATVVAAVADRFGAVDGAAASNGDDGVDCIVF